MFNFFHYWLNNKMDATLNEYTFNVDNYKNYEITTFLKLYTYLYYLFIFYITYHLLNVIPIKQT